MKAALASFAVEDPAGGNEPLQIGSVGPLKGSVSVPEAALRRLETRYVRDDRLRIRCTVRVLEEESPESESRPAATTFRFVAPPGITRCVASLLEEGGDVTFAVEGRRFAAHRLVLAMRSPVFRAMFFGGTGDSSRDREPPFRVDDMRAAVFGAMLHYVYTDELLLLEDGKDSDDDSVVAEELLVAADLYDLERLRLMCEKALWESVVRQGRSNKGSGRAISVLSLVSGRDKCRRLEELCAGYVAGGWEAATASDEYRDLKATCPAALNDVLERLVAHLLVGGRRRSPEPIVAASSEYRLADVRRGSHRLTVAGHSRVRAAHGRGEFIRSGAFEVGGHEWRLLYYPSGYYQHDPDHVAVVLQLVAAATTDAVIHLSGTFKVGGGGPDGETSTSMLDFSHVYTAAAPEAGNTGVLTVAHVQSRLVGPHDTLTIECHFELELANPNPVAQRQEQEDLQLLLQEIAVPPPSMAWHLSLLLETGLGSDVTFSVEERDIRAHTLVLSARAPALLQQAQPAEVVRTSTRTRRKQQKASASAAGGNNENKNPLVLWVEGITAVVFEALLHFVYTDELPPLDDLLASSISGGDDPPLSSRRTRMAGDLLAAAERYQLVERMRPLCENLLCEVITPETAPATLELARRHAGPELKAFCLDYMSSPAVLGAVAATQGYKDLPAEALRDLIDHIAAASLA
ncbi:unnamed protein product [Urochloa humidicola]